MCAIVCACRAIRKKGEEVGKSDKTKTKMKKCKKCGKMLSAEEEHQRKKRF